MIDILLLILSTLLGFCVGTYVEKKITARERLYLDLFRYCKQMQINVVYSQKTLSEFTDNFIKTCSSGDFLKFADKDGNVNVKPFAKLKSDETLAINEFFDKLVQDNSAAWKSHLEYYEGCFSDILAEAKNDTKTKGSVCRKLGLLAGITLGLMLL